MTRKCVICGKGFQCAPSSKKVTCSRECSRERKRQTHTGKSNAWSEEAKTRLREKGQTANLKNGADAARMSPISGRYETNQEAKIWILVDPAGNEIIVRNLLLWARENTHLFNKPPGDKSALQISCGFRAIAQTISGNRGAPGKPRGAMTYFGWTLKNLPEKPES